MATSLFEISSANYYQVQIDVQDKLGNTPLHLALDKSNVSRLNPCPACSRFERIASYIVQHAGNLHGFKLLLEKGANPNLVNNDGSTPLHVICRREKYIFEDWMKTFLKINDANHQNVSLDVADKMGRTPLHLALAHDHKKLVELLIRRGANANVADAEGLTPLHMICKQDDLAGFLTTFFEINLEVNQLVQVNVEDKKGRTPLQWAHRNISEKFKAASGT
ncbi:unnamed protein product [Trichogramma brassicae]|uniref:Uncharacterized protein n=1 Tax=Trichogramma brassicae TaxID=86971 RepID=A0A6H5J2I0_9HYME|nr:unnamed protein product [Trichogramma brassicae]